MQTFRLALIAIVLVLPVSADARSAVAQTAYIPGRESDYLYARTVVGREFFASVVSRR
jgi:hypothetical protein